MIGIVTLYDFLKNLQLKPYTGFQGKWLAFIKRTPATTTNKPEAVGHIMSRKVITVSADANFCVLIPLLIEQGHRYVPIVDHEQRFAGLISQTDLIAALIRAQLQSTGQFMDAGNR